MKNAKTTFARALVTLTIALVMSVTVAQAQTTPAAPTDQSIDELFTVSKVSSMMDEMYGAMGPVLQQSMSQSLRGKPITPAQQRILDQLPVRFPQIMRQAMPWEQMRPVIAQVYKETFEQEEINGLTAFYKSPTGQALINKIPAVTRRTMALMQAQIPVMMQRMQPAIQQLVAELTAAQ